LYKFLIISAYISLIFLISIALKKKNPSNKELLRKIIHIGIGPLIPLAKYLEIQQTSALYFTLLITTLILINYIYKIFPTIEDIERKSYGTLFYCLSLLILIQLFWEKDPISLIAGFFIMTFGDGFAGLIGKNIYSSNWTIFKQKKSFLGTLTMFLISLIIVFFLCYFNNLNINTSYLIIPITATILEQFSVIGIDNFIVPIASSIGFNLLITKL
tara:strand:+ start:1295 stop:1939 length:645 start_codon:yes stop_codon:yes gene_type:complete